MFYLYLFYTLSVGRRVKVRHIRDGEELKEIVFDNNYDFNFQVSQKFFCVHIYPAVPM